MNDTPSPRPVNPLAPLRLTSFSHGGGCGCKIAPGVLSQILKSSGAGDGHCDQRRNRSPRAALRR